MPLSDRRLPSATDEVSAEPAAPVARGGTAADASGQADGTAQPGRTARAVKRADQTSGDEPDEASRRTSQQARQQTPDGMTAPAPQAAAGKASASAKSAAKSSAKASAKPAAKPVDKLAKLGLTRDIDLVLHLPMRYEDETSLTPIGHLLPGGIAQTEGVVFDNEIAYRPRRQLLVKLRDDAGDELVLRFLNFYGSQVKQMAIGARLRVRGDVRGGFFGMEMVHPAVRVVDEDTPLPQALTPVYPSTAGVTQAYLRKSIDNALSRTSLPELLPEAVARQWLQPLGVPSLMDAVRTLHHPGA
ncbi:MAG: ATP-dependent DNA helicase RecG, partial [Paraburkholderia caledonica]